MGPELMREYLQGTSKSKTCSVPSRKPGSMSWSHTAQRDQTGRLIPKGKGVTKRRTQKNRKTVSRACMPRHTAHICHKASGSDFKHNGVHGRHKRLTIAAGNRNPSSL